MTPGQEEDLLLRVERIEENQATLIATVHDAKVGLRVLAWVGGLAIAFLTNWQSLYELGKQFLKAGGNGG